MNKEVSKSPEMLQKEAKIKELQANLKKRKSILKGLKTRLENSKKEIEEVQFKSSTQIVGIMERMEELRLEIIELAKKLKNLKTLSKDDRVALGMMADELENEDMLREDYKEFQRQRKERQEGNFEFDFDEEERAKFRDIFKEFQVKPDEKEQKDIRKVFVKLANKFHPDRARTEKEAAEFHEMQQRLNEAYQSGDIHTLLELERLYLMEELDLSEAKAYTVDVLQQAIEKLAQELEFIENQISRYQQEIKSLRASDFGSMLTQLKRAKKEGFGFEDSLEDMESSIEEMSQLRDAMKESLEMGELSPKMMAMAYGPMNDASLGSFDPDMSQEEAIEFLNEILSGGDLFGKMNNHSEQANKKAKFKIDDTVKIKRAIKHLDGTNLKGFVGRVSFIDFNLRGQLEYEISLDSVSLQKLPKTLIQECTDQFEDFQDILVLEKDLERCEPRDTLEESIASYRMIYHQYNWKYLDNPAQEKRIQDILLAKPAENDEANWEHYLTTKISYPFVGRIRGLMNNPPNHKIEVVGFSDFDYKDGCIMKVKLGKQKGDYPLFDIKSDEKNPKTYQFLEDYNEWQGEALDDEDDFFF